MRNTKKEAFFPYAAKTICYFEVSANGNVQQVSCSKESIAEACFRVKAECTTLYAVWPGKYKSDLFVVDDIDALSDAFGIERDKQHKHIVNYSLSDYDDGKSPYASVNISFDCGCKLTLNNIKVIASDLKKQFGWQMTTTTSFGSRFNDGETVYSVRILRSSLSNRHSY